VIRFVGMQLMGFAFTLGVLLAQEPRPAQEDRGVNKAPEKGQDDSKARSDGKAKPGDDVAPKKVPKLKMVDPDKAKTDAKELIERIHKNMDSSQERLGKQDPGADTRKIQKNIVKDLDDLIDQMENQNQSQSSSSSSSKSKSQSKSSASQGADQGKSDKQDQAKGGPKQDEKKAPASAKGQPKTGKAGSDPKQGKDDLTKAGMDPRKGDGGKDPKDLTKKGGVGGDSNMKEKNTVADLFKDVWGHLPSMKRLEMDAYSRERFMPRYDDILRQYYRTIAEQGRKKEE